MIRRRIDKLSRITIPKEMLNAMGVNQGLQPLFDIKLNPDKKSVTISKLEDSCIMCGIEDNLLSVGKTPKNKKLICANCITEIKKL